MNTDIKTTIEIIENLESRINSYWNFYVIVIVAVVGWLMASKITSSPYQKEALVLSVALFFAANFSVMRAATKRVLAFEQELNALAANHQFASPALKTELTRPSLRGRLFSSYVLHGGVDLAVIFTIWTKLGC